MPPCPDRRAARWRRASHHRRPHRLSLGCVRRVSWFCSLKGNEFFAEVEEDFIQDDFNLTGLSAQVPHYEFALDTILDVESPATAGFSEEQQESIESAAELLYGLIHARFIITPRGMSAMLDKYKNTHFGRCPRAFCQGQPVLPVGQARLLPAPQQPTCPSPLSPDARARNKKPAHPSSVALACGAERRAAHAHEQGLLPQMLRHLLPPLATTGQRGRRLLWHHVLPPLPPDLLGPRAAGADDDVHAEDIWIQDPPHRQAESRREAWAADRREQQRERPRGAGRPREGRCPREQ